MDKAKPERSFLFGVSNLARKMDLFINKHMLRAWLRQLSQSFWNEPEALSFWNFPCCRDACSASWRESHGKNEAGKSRLGKVVAAFHVQTRNGGRETLTDLKFPSAGPAYIAGTSSEGDGAQLVRGADQEDCLVSSKLFWGKGRMLMEFECHIM